MDNADKGFSVRDITRIGLMVALIEVSKFVLGGIPNIELMSKGTVLFDNIRR